MIGHGNGHRPFRSPPLHHNVASSPSNFSKPVTFKNLADLPAG